jgi:hypothetical protein
MELVIQIGIERLDNWKKEIDKVGQKEKRYRLHVGNRDSL